MKKKSFYDKGDREIEKKPEVEHVRVEGDYNPELAALARKYEATCFLCGELKRVAFEPIEGVPVICDDCQQDLIAKKLMYGSQKDIKSIKRLTCKACQKIFYAPDETHLVCYDCYQKFSEQILSKTKQIRFFTCERCGARESLPERVFEEKNVTLCRHCIKIARRQERMKKVHRKKVDAQD